MLFRTSALLIYLTTATSLEAFAHTLFEPAIGVANNGVGVRRNVQRPNNANPCGRNVDITTAVAQSTVAIADSTGAFNVNAQNFNRYTTFKTTSLTSLLILLCSRVDGSRSIASAVVDTTATGNSFTSDVTVTKNGQRVSSSSSYLSL